jgi:hypothetical protein
LSDKVVAYEIVVQHKKANDGELRDADLELETFVERRIETCKRLMAVECVCAQSTHCRS